LEFRRHGEYEIKVMDDLLFIDAQGPFNSEAVHDFQKSLHLATMTLENLPRWYQLAVLHEVSIFTPDAMDELFKVTQWRMTKGLAASAVVFVGTMSKQLSRIQIGAMYQELGLKHEFFDSVEAATSWIDNLRSESP